MCVVLLSIVGGLLDVGLHDDADDNGVETQSWCENDHNQHGNKGRAILGRSQSCRSSKDSNANSANNLWNANSHANPERSEAGIFSDLVVCLGRILIGLETVAELRLAIQKQQSHDDAVDSTRFAQNDTNQVFGRNTGHLDHGANNWRTTDLDAPCGAHHREENGCSEANVEPCSRVYAVNDVFPASVGSLNANLGVCRVNRLHMLIWVRLLVLVWGLFCGFDEARVPFPISLLLVFNYNY